MRSSLHKPRIAAIRSRPFGPSRGPAEVLLTLTALGVLCLLAAAPAAGATSGAEQTKVFFSRGSATSLHSAGDVFAMSADGSETERLTRDPNHAFQDPTAPSLDPAAHGKLDKIAFWSHDSSGNSVWTLDLAGGQPQRIASGSYPTISPDGKKIAFLRGVSAFTAQIDMPVPNDGIWIMNVDGSGKHRLTAPSWSNPSCTYPDAGGTPESVGIQGSPSFSPDGTKIAYVAHRDVDPDPSKCDDQTDIYVMNADGTGETRATHLPDRASKAALSPVNVDWSPDGNHFAFWSQGSDHNPAIYTVAYGSGSAQQITSPGYGKGGVIDRDPTFSPDGSRIDFERIGANSSGGLEKGVYEVGASGGAITRRNTGGNPDWTAAPDTDEDALLDLWEKKGIDFNADGDLEDRLDVNLPKMGADPKYKDIFVESDYMQGHKLKADAARYDYDAFRAAPVSNPNGQTGILLHIDNGRGSIMNPRTLETWQQNSRQDELRHENTLGSLGGGRFSWASFDAVKRAHLVESRRHVFHYAVMSHFVAPGANRVTGISRGIPGSDLQVSLGYFCPPPSHACAGPSVPGIADGLALEEGVTLMHELGHNLGLHHGGGDDVNGKPNYLSVMNYLFSNIGLVRDLGGGGFRAGILDYSHVRIGSLNENAIDERAGFPGAFGTWAEGFRTPRIAPAATARGCW